MINRSDILFLIFESNFLEGQQSIVTEKKKRQVETVIEPKKCDFNCFNLRKMIQDLYFFTTKSYVRSVAIKLEVHIVCQISGTGTNFTSLRFRCSNSKGPRFLFEQFYQIVRMLYSLLPLTNSFGLNMYEARYRFSAYESPFFLAKAERTLEQTREAFWITDYTRAF